MPEGDTIHRLARRIGPALVGHEVHRIDIGPPERPVRIAGVTVTSVRAHGKTMFVALDDDRVVRVHLGMYGSWHRYAPGERWHRAASSARLVFATDRDVLVCFRPLHADVLPSLAATPGALDLGPDVLDPAFDPEVVARRTLSASHETVAEALLDQSIASGVGNIYKCEILFLNRVDPFATPERNGRARIERLWATAARTMTDNLRRRGRSFGAPDGMWVYRREGRPCYECGTAIACRRHGADLPRATWWCPTCQRATD